METFCNSDADNSDDEHIDELPLVFHSNSQSLIITYNWEPGGEDGTAASEGFNCTVAFPKRPHREYFVNEYATPVLLSRCVR